MLSRGLTVLAIACAVGACELPDGAGVEQRERIVDAESYRHEAYATAPRDTLITDTVITDEGYMILNHGFYGWSKWDSIDILVNGTRVRSQLMSSGPHTSLKWTNDRFVCFYFGCGSPCWGEQYIDLQEEVPIKQVIFPIWSDSVRSLVVYPDTSNSCCGLILENLKDEREVRVTLDTTKAVSLALSFDTTWVHGEMLHMKLHGTSKVEHLDLKQVQ